MEGNRNPDQEPLARLAFVASGQDKVISSFRPRRRIKVPVFTLSSFRLLFLLLDGTWGGSMLIVKSMVPWSWILELCDHCL